MSLSNPSYVQYFPNGSGRDSYINANSGGFSRFMPKQVINPHYEIIKPSFPSSKYQDISKTSWTFKYKSDGSGRDSYILQGSGGLQREYREPRAFRETLRKGFFSLENPSSSKTDKTISNVKGKIRFVSKDEYLIAKKLSKIQEGVTKRLYTSSQSTKKVDSNRLPNLKILNATSQGFRPKQEENINNSKEKTNVSLQFTSNNQEHSKIEFHIGNDNINVKPSYVPNTQEKYLELVAKSKSNTIDNDRLNKYYDELTEYNKRNLNKNQLKFIFAVKTK